MLIGIVVPVYNMLGDGNLNYKLLYFYRGFRNRRKREVS